jgi:hypothetical protein
LSDFHEIRYRIFFFYKNVSGEVSWVKISCDGTYGT